MTKKKPQTLPCPRCGRILTGAVAMQAHLRDMHQITGDEAHAIANPNDRQFLRAKNRRRVQPKFRRAETKRLRCDDDFQVIE